MLGKRTQDDLNNDTSLKSVSKLKPKIDLEIISWRVTLEVGGVTKAYEIQEHKRDISSSNDTFVNKVLLYSTPPLIPLLSWYCKGVVKERMNVLEGENERD